MTWQQQQERRYLDRLRERWNEDGTQRITFSNGTSITLPNNPNADEAETTCSTLYHIHGTSYYCSLPYDHAGKCEFPNMPNSVKHMPYRFNLCHQ